MSKIVAGRNDARLVALSGFVSRDNHRSRGAEGFTDLCGMLRQLEPVDATARDGKPNPLNEREAKAELWGRGLPVQRGTALENDDMGGGGGGL